MQHNFDIEIAKEYGLYEAILLNNIYYWIEKNKANNTHFYDGYYWTYNSIKAFIELFPYLTKRKIETALNNLKECGLIIVGNYNTNQYDRTNWYALTEKGNAIFKNVKSILPICEMESCNMGNGLPRNVKPIPDINTNNKTQIENTNINKQNSTKKQPTYQEVLEYAKERGREDLAKKFYDYYTAMEWTDKDGKKVLRWKGKFITWENRNPVINKKGNSDGKDYSIYDE